jgi:hypothetical protein
MHAQETKAAELFASGKQMRVPVWQRRYSWTRVEWDALWEDLERLQREPNLTHFIGSVVIRMAAHPKEGMPDIAEQFDLVDGQQRVATLTLLRAAIRDRLADLKGGDHRAILTRQMLINDDKCDEHKPRLVLQQLDDPALRAIVSGGTAGSGPVRDAHQHFYRKLAKFEEPQLLALETIIQNRLRVVWIKLDPGDNAHRVFQTINAGGRPLRQADLVRNFFFLLLKQDGERFYQDHWQNLESGLNASELERYFMAWTMTEGHEGSRDSLFDYFESDLTGEEFDPGQVWKYGERLVREAALYRRILGKERDPEPRVEAALQWLRGWGTSPTEGLLLQILQLREHKRLCGESTAACLELIYSFLARRFVAGNAPNLHKPILRQICHRLGRNETAKNNGLVEFLRVLLSRGSELKRWPTDQEVVDQAAVGVLYTKARAAWANSVLARINSAQFKSSKHAPQDLSQFTVEHLMPQELTSDWRSDLLGWGVKDPSDLHSRKLHVLGNLTLTLINSELSNKRLAAKVELLEDDTLRINKSLKLAKSWTESAIVERSRELAWQLVKSLPGPMSESEMKASEFWAESEGVDAAEPIGDDD